MSRKTKTKRRKNNGEAPEETLKRFIAFNKAVGKAETTIKSYTRIIKDLAGFFKKPFKNLRRKDLELYLANWADKDSRKIKGKNFDELGNGETRKTSEATMNFVRTVLKLFYKWLYGSEEYPTSVKWIKLKKIVRELNPRDMLTEDDVRKLLRASESEKNEKITIRNQSLIHVLIEAGGRINKDIMSRKVKDLEFEYIKSDDTDEEYLTVKLAIPSRRTGTSKDQSKYLRLIDSALALQNWLNVHPNPEPESPVWVNLETHLGKQMSYTLVFKTLKRYAKLAGVTKPVNPHNFRHTAVTISATYMQDQELKRKFGWSKGSPMLQIYSHIRDEDVENKELEARGIKRTQRRGKRLLTNIKCGDCGKIYSAGRRICECGRPLDPDIAKLWDQEKQEKELKLTNLLEKLANLPTDKLSILEKLLE